MKKCLIILTSEFPFSAGEPFLESEIKYQKQCFDKVIVLAQDLDKKEKKYRAWVMFLKARLIFLKKMICSPKMRRNAILR